MYAQNMTNGSGPLISIVNASKGQLQKASNRSPCRPSLLMPLVSSVEFFSKYRTLER